MTRSTDENDVLERNVSTLIESGGEPPKMADAARARIRDELVGKHARGQNSPSAAAPSRVRARTPMIAVGFGLAATAAAAFVVTRVVGTDETSVQTGGSNKLADGSTYLTDAGAKVTVLGPRRVRVEGAALLDVAPGKGTFVVETAEGRIEVLGTRFLVDAQATRTTTAVVRGTVKLATEQGAVVIHAGEQAVAEHGRPPVRGPAPRLSHLVSWAQQARRREENTGVKPLRNGSLFARDPGVRPNGTFGEEYPLPMAQLTVDVVVEDRVARVALDQTFRNPHDRVLEGVYKFAIPPDAALQRLAMYIDGKLTESAVVERMQARRIYEELVYRRIDPALLEYAGVGRLNLRVYPIPARQDKRLMVAYTQSVPKLYSDWTLDIPLPEVDQPVGDFVVSARIKGCANCELSAPGQKIAIERSGNDAIVKLHTTGAHIGDSFVVHVREAKAVATVAQNTDGADRYLMVRAPAELGSAPREHRARTWVILDDVSASRSTYELAAQADLVDAFLRELDEEDTVSVIAFDVEARHLLAQTRVDAVDRRAVRAMLREEGGVGATDFAKALDAAVTSLAGVAPDDAMIVYLGDGMITSGARNLDALRAKLVGKAHFVGVGVGDGPDTQTLDALAGATGGFSTTIDLADDVGWRAFDLVAALHTTRVTGLSAKLVDSAGGLVASTSYLRSPQLADGEELELVARLASDATPVALELTGTRDGAPWQHTITLAQAGSTDAGYLPRLWAIRHVAARLLAKHEPVIVPPCTTPVVTRQTASTRGPTPPVVCPTEGELRATRDEEIRKEVVTLGKQYFLLSRHTSLLVLENDAMYAKYGVRKGSGDTWAPYALPEKVAVVTAPVVAVPDDVADDAELVRTPLQIFYDQQNYYGYDDDIVGGIAEGAFAATQPWQGGLGTMGTIGHGSGVGRGGGGAVAVTNPFTAETERGGEPTRASLGLSSGPPAPPAADREELFVSEKSGERVASKSAPRALKPSLVLGKRGMISTREVQRVSGFLGPVDMRRERSLRRANRHHAQTRYGVGTLTPARYTYTSDVAYDDISALIPALVPDAADIWREQLRAAVPTKTSFPIDPAAKQLLQAARAGLPSGVYRWGDIEIAVDGARRIGWRRTTETGLVETASLDASTWTRRYAELGLTATRGVRDDALAVALAYLPIWIAEPEHYARWFVVTSRGPRDIGLSVKSHGKDALAYVLHFDDSNRLVSIADGEGDPLLSVTWSATGPVAARVLGGDISVGFTATAIADAAQWAFGSSQPGVLVELPSRLPAFWKKTTDKEAPGTPAWRHAQRQRMVAAAALQDRTQLAQLYDDLRKNGGVELGDLVLASAGVATATTDAQFAVAVAPLAQQPLAKYLVAGRAFGKSPTKPARLAPEMRDGALGALWTLRMTAAQLQNGNHKEAVDELLTLGDRAFAFRLLGAALVGQRYADPKDVMRAWDSVATGPYKNLARAQAAQSMYQHGQYDAAADQVKKMVSELDLDALAPRLDLANYVFQYSRRGTAGGALVMATWREKVLAGSSFDHLMALLPMMRSQTVDLPQFLARASQLAGDNVERKIAVAQAAVGMGNHALARSIIEPLLTSSPTRELCALAASMAQSRTDLPAALGYLEQAQVVGADEEVDLATVRSELRQIISLAQQIALQASGRERKDAVARAMTWGARWRAIDPGNAEIDQTLGNLLLATGDTAGAWRQLSSAIERDPWSQTGYATVADSLERQGKIDAALELWQQAIVIDQTNPNPRLRKAQALIALGRDTEGDALLEQIATQKWHDMWSSTVYQAKSLWQRGPNGAKPANAGERGPSQRP